jgi:hypothetical protein
MKLSLNNKIEILKMRQLLSVDCTFTEVDLDIEATCKNATLSETSFIHMETLTGAVLATVGQVLPLAISYAATHFCLKAITGIDIHNNHKMIRNLIGIIGYELSHELTHDVIRADAQGNSHVHSDLLYWIFKPSAEIVKIAENIVNSAQKKPQTECLLEHSQPKSLYNNIIEILPVLGVIQLLNIGFPHIEPIAVA